MTLLRPAVHPLPSHQLATPFFTLFSPWVTWSRTGRHGNRANRDGNSTVGRSPLSLSLSLSLSPPFYSAFSDIAFRPLFLSLFVNVLTYSHLALFVVSKLSLAPSCSFLPPGRFLCLPSSDRPHARNPRTPSRFPVARSR